MRALIACLLFAGVGSSGVVVAGCSAGPGTACGPGTVQQGTACVPEVRCGPGTVAVDGTCVVPFEAPACTPTCAADQECGGDGCGGSCGTCASGLFCVAGRCVSECTPACGDRACGDDGCGGSCGTCGEATACSAIGRCVPSAWACNASDYADGQACQCACGAVDPDCANAALRVLNCPLAGATCDAEGACAGGDPLSSWRCSSNREADGLACDCNCGAPDPDCVTGALPVVGCSTGETCPTGVCLACVPDCDGRECGVDGCGGSCGSCANPAFDSCDASGRCVACQPQCSGRTCGDDGCGGSCGTCQAGSSCFGGVCELLPASASCNDRCGGTAPAGCSCAAGCAADGACCEDVTSVCGCQPLCTGFECGDDGCGGSCGGCGPGESCGGHACFPDPCGGTPCSGHGLCSASSPAGPALCSCAEGYTGATCDACASGYIGYPDCARDRCTPNPCSVRGTCAQATGLCACEPGFRGPACSVCFDGHGTFPNCSVPACGDGVLDFGEECDDRNTADSDGCSSHCLIESGWRCRNAVNVNTGSDNSGTRAPVGAQDLVWTWSEALNGPRQPALVAGNCPNNPALWRFAAPYAEWVNRYGCSVNSPFDNTTYYHATFQIPTLQAAAATTIQATVWADNRIATVLVNGTPTGLTGTDPGFNGPGISFGAWPSSLYVQGLNTITVAVYNGGSSPNPDGLLVEAPGVFGTGSRCSRE